MPWHTPHQLYVGQSFHKMNPKKQLHRQNWNSAKCWNVPSEFHVISRPIVNCCVVVSNYLKLVMLKKLPWSIQPQRPTFHFQKTFTLHVLENGLWIPKQLSGRRLLMKEARANRKHRIRIHGICQTLDPTIHSYPHVTQCLVPNPKVPLSNQCSTNSNHGGKSHLGIIGESHDIQL